MPFFCPREGGLGGREGAGHWESSQSMLPHNPPHLISPDPKYYCNALWFESKRAPHSGVCWEHPLGPRTLAQPALPWARLSQGQMTSFSVACSADSPVPVSSESIRQVPLSVGTSILIWKKLRAQKESTCGDARDPRPPAYPVEE